MKKIVAFLLIVTLALSLCACDASDYKRATNAFDNGNYEKARELFDDLGDYKDSEDMVEECDYQIACELMDTKEYGEAAELFDALGDYKDSEDKADECRTEEIDAILQGRWLCESSGITMSYEFTNGRFNITMTIGTTSVDNVGDYRIDTDSKSVYVCYDYLLTTSGKTPNTEEKLLFTYTYNGANFVLKNSTDDILEKD